MKTKSMKTNTRRQFIYFCLTVFITLGISISVQSLLAAWSNPTIAPPGGNLDLPINSGNVMQGKLGSFGIGTTTPSEKLEVRDDTTGTARIRITDTVQNPELQLKYGAGGSDHWAIYNGQSDDSLNIWGNGVNKITVLQDGNIGIRTSTPQGLLDVNGALTVQSAIISSISCINPSSCGSGNVNNIVDKNFDTNWYPSNYNAEAKIIYSNTIIGNYQIKYKWSGDGNSPNCAGKISISTNDTSWTDIVNGAASTTQTYSGNTPFKYLKVKIPSNGYPSTNCGWVSISEVLVNNNMLINGNVGIGTSAPEKSLHIKTVEGSNAEINIQSGSKAKWGIYHDESNEQLRFWNSDNRMMITKDGNVGIGTITPGQKLDVNGALRLQPSATPTAANGVIYYNSTSNKFQCYQNGAWVDCISSGATFANPTASIGLTAINGSATIAMRSDAAPALSQAIVPIWTGAHTFSANTNFPGSGIWNTSGNVGIETTAPGYKLSVVDTGIVPMVNIWNNSAINRWTGTRLARGGTGDGTEKWFMGMNDLDNNFRITRNGGNAEFTIDTATGNVEIAKQIKISGGTPGLNKVLTSDANGLASWGTATTLPAGTSGQTLRYDGTNSLVANSVLLNDGTNITTSGNLTVGGNILLNSAQIIGWGGNPSKAVIQGVDDGSIFIGGASDTTGGISLMTNGQIKMTVNNAGNVGIGTTTPSAKLHIQNGGIKLTSPDGSKSYTISVNNAGEFVIYNNTTEISSAIFTDAELKVQKVTTP